MLFTIKERGNEEWDYQRESNRESLIANRELKGKKGVFIA